MDDKLFGVLSTTGGLVAGWILNETSSWIRNNRENRRVLNQVLYTQLEIRDVIKKTNISHLKEDLSKILIAQFPEQDALAFKEFFEPFLFEFLEQSLHEKFGQRLNLLIEDYKNQISELSKIDPFTTFYISNKEKLFDYLGLVREYLDGMEKHLDQKIGRENMTPFSTDPDIQHVFQTLTTQLTPTLYQEALETIEDDIKDVAKGLGLIQRFKTRTFLKRTKTIKMDSSDTEKIKNLIADYLKTFQQLET